MDVTVTEQPRDEAVVLALRGQLDIDAAARLQRTVDDLLDRQANRIVVDLTPLQFCDSTGLSAFVVAERACAESGGWLRLAAPNAFLTRVLHVVGLLDRLPVYRTVAAALAGDDAQRVSPPPQPD
ncbi:MAG TPA: STAS domain-containing protein [Pilimelia sp.]|nr:STAS domain-containing protein [Pilimelia sp.]